MRGKDYKLIAKALRRAKLSKEQSESVCLELVTVFKQDNPRFVDPKPFLAMVFD